MNWIPATNQFLDNNQNDIDKDILLKHIKSYIKKIKSNEIEVNKTKQDVLDHFQEHIKKILTSPFKPIINATGILLHTNLGRAPMSDKAFDLLKDYINYTNIEFNLQTGKRAYRDDYLKNIFSFITGSEDVVVVNNNAAALYLIINTFAAPKHEVIISRGELIEIGGSFRIPDIIKQAGAVLREVGTTNCTRISDYENAINDKTALILKAHTSNFHISGYTESASIDDLINLSQENFIPLVYDAGAGLIKKPKLLKDIKELTISEYIDKGIDMICFSGDKLLGSSQSGIILGKKEYLKDLKKNPLMRVLRADKLTITNLYQHISMYKSEDELLKYNLVYSLLSQSEDDLRKKAELLSQLFIKNGVKNKINKVNAFSGGGTLPDLQINSYEIEFDNIADEEMYYKLLKLDKPIVGLLRERKFYINVFALDIKDFDYIVGNV